MTRLRMWLWRITALIRNRQLDEDLREQIASHLEEAAEDYLKQGLSATDARYAALRSFGNVAHVEEAYRDAHGRWLRDFSKDVSYALRTLRRYPAFVTVAVLSLAVGIGANTAIFSFVNALLLRPRAVANAEQLVELYVGDRQQPYDTCSYPSYTELRDRNGVLSGLAAYSIWQFRVGDANQVEQIWGEVVSGNYFDVLGVRAHHGRTFAVADDVAPGRNPVAVIAHSLWQRRFNADPDVIGQTVAINGHKLTIIGIAPPHYTGSFRGLASEIWVPVMMLPVLEPTKGQAMIASRGSRWLVLLGRLAPETTIAQARARFDLLGREMQVQHPEEWRSRREDTAGFRELFVSVLSERESRIHPDMRESAYAVMALVMVIVNLVLLIACMNLAGMLLARAVERRREIAVRLAIGATRLRIIRQLITESVLLALVAGAAGFALTIWLLNLLVAFMPAFPEGIRLALDLQLDWRVLAYTIVFSTVTGILFGLAPALQSSRPNVSVVLKNDANALTGSYQRSRTRMALVVAQVAFSLLLLIAAALVLRSLENVRPTRLGFSSDNILVATLTLDEARYDRASSQRFYRDLAERVSALPGVAAVSLVQGMPGGFMSRSRRGTEIEGYQPAADESMEILFSFVGPRYFTTMNVPIVQGRDFDERDRDGAPCVAIVNEAFVERYFKNRAALGTHLTKFEGRRPPTKQLCEIVGVIRDNEWQSLQKEPLPFYALALQQTHRTQMSLLVHMEGDPARHINPVRRTLQALDPHMPVNDVQPLVDYFSATVYPFKLLAMVMAACGTMALLLATIGIYGVVSYSVAQRTREVGIRIALGALHKEILRMVVGQGMSLVVWGLVFGVLLSVALTRVLTSSLFESELLFGVSPTDSMTFAGVTIMLALVALAACYVPALRATRVQPLEALRYE